MSQRTPGENPLEAAALRYAGYGWHVFPLHTPLLGGCSCRSANCASIGKHPRTLNGAKDASTDPNQIQQWWRTWPQANLAIATGPSRLLVLDVDPGKSGDASLDALIARYGRSILDTVTARTGGGGMHYLYVVPEGISLGNTAGKLGTGLDTRGQGGHVVAPPSLHASGGLYEWLKWHDPDSRWPASLPRPLLDLLRPAPDRGDVSRTMEQWREIAAKGAPESERNVVTTALAGYVFRHGIDRQVAAELLHCWNACRNQPPLPAAEVEKIVTSIGTRELRRREGR